MRDILIILRVYFAGSLTGRNHIGVKFYYVIRILEKVDKSGIWEDGALYENRENAHCSDCGVYAGVFDCLRHIQCG